MPRLSARVDARDMKSAFSTYYRFAEQRIERAALIATDRSGRALKASLREEFAGAGLGRLGQAYGAKSDLDRGGIQRRFAGGGFSASSTVYVRSKSDRTRGAIISYTQGADIAPVRGRWLWIPTEDIQRLVGKGARRRRLTPALWSEYGLDAKVGPLVFVRNVNGYPLLVVRNVGASLAGAPRSARSLTKAGRPRKGQIEKQFLVAFVGIPRTSRAARVDPIALANQVIGDFPRQFLETLGRI